jgi:hypothetical protein
MIARKCEGDSPFTVRTFLNNRRNLMFSLIITLVATVAMFYPHSMLGVGPQLLGFPINHPITASAAVDIDEDSTFPGVWRGSMKVKKITCQTEYVFQENHKYSSTIVCGPYRLWQTGNWKIMKQGVLRFEILDYEPKKYAGGDVHMQDSDVLNYSFVNKDHIFLKSSVEGVSDSDIYRAK